MATIPNLPFSGQALKTALDEINQEVGNIPAGDDGADGRTVLSGSGAPASGLGADGDFYIDTDATAIYGPKASGAWGAATSLVGPGAAGYAATIGDGSATSIAVTHSLNTTDVVVQVFEVSSGTDVIPDITRTDADTVTLAFGTAPTTDQYRVVVLEVQ